MSIPRNTFASLFFIFALIGIALSLNSKPISTQVLGAGIHAPTAAVLHSFPR